MTRSPVEFCDVCGSILLGNPTVCRMCGAVQGSQSNRGKRRIIPVKGPEDDIPKARIIPKEKIIDLSKPPRPAEHKDPYASWKPARKKGRGDEVDQ